MHQLTRNARAGLGQPAQFCTACFSAFASPSPAAWRTAQCTVRQQQSRRYAKSSTSSTTESIATEVPAESKKSTDSSTPSSSDTNSPETIKKLAAAGSFRNNPRSASTFVAGRKNKKAAKAAARALQTGSVSQASQTQLKLWRETLDVLTKLEKAQGRLAEQAAIATGAATEAIAKDKNAPSEEGQVGEAAADTSKSKKKKKAPVYTEEQKQAALESAKEAQEQVKMLTSALHLLKTVLSTQGSQKKPADTDSKDSKDSKGEQADTKPGKNAKKKQRKKAEQAASSAEEAAKETNKAEGEATAKETSRSPVDSSAPKSVNGSAPTPVGASSPAAVDVSVPVTAISSASALLDGSAPITVKKASSTKKKGARGTGSEEPYRVNSVESHILELQPVEENMRPVPRLHYGLDRALFNPGVYHLQDPRSRVFNFDPYLASIMPLQEFDFNALKQYVTSSKDSTLISMAHKYNMKYSGSTSSMTSLLSHFHFLLSSWRPINVAHTTRSFTPESMNYTRIMRSPAATFLHYKDGTYAIDADKEFDSANILSMLGKSMEKLLTLSKEDFEKYRVTRSHELTEEERNDPESFHYTTFGDFMMRSQLDAYDARLPGTGMFDLKTRAVVSIRMDARDFQRGLGYEIRNRFGQWESFEREYFDMIRSAFLKYSLQVRMGRMDGIYVAFHNTQRIFGFQYISINEMDLALHGTEDRTLGDREFMLSLRLLNSVLDKATERFPGRSLRLHVETRPSVAAPFMYVFATPVTPEEIAEVQDASKESVEAFERNILGMTSGVNSESSETDNIADAAAGSADADLESRGYDNNDDVDLNYDEDEDGVDVWETMRQRVEETMENEAQGITTVRDTIEDALEQSGLLRGQSPEETRAYVDALLEAVTRMDTEAVAETLVKGQDNAAAEVEAEPEENTDADVSQGAPETLNESKTADEATATGSSESALSPDNETSSPAYDISKSIIDEDGDNYVIDSDTASKDGAVPSSSSSSPSGALSLKDLIIKLAAKVEASAARDDASSTITTTGSLESTDELQTDADKTNEGTASSETSVSSYNSNIAEIVEDAPKNKRFERILSALMASSKEGKASKLASSSTSETASTSSSSSTSSSPTAGSTTEPTQELLGMIVTIRNKVNGRYVTRPQTLIESDKWTVEYAVEEIQDKRAQSLYEMLKKRRKDLLYREDKDGASVKDVKSEGDDNKGKTAKASFNRDFMEKLYEMSARGRRFRRAEDDAMRDKPIHVYGIDESIAWKDIFGSNDSGSTSSNATNEAECEKAE
ncbi:hypothetical protein SBRCBS47491_008597 [Sporothrix bragantina]|uniref:Mitochondrial mRNA processing protein n=1 Tax=Sporothrix bragantina TaxID=671064 RepID=A0ABP0CPV2_9PEZI